jgi:hypothetical protein
MDVNLVQNFNSKLSRLRKLIFAQQLEEAHEYEKGQ